MRQYEGYAADLAAAYTDDYEAGWDFYYDGGRRREHGGVRVSDQFDRGYADARYAEGFGRESQSGFAGFDS